MDGLPFLPGNTFQDPTKTNFHVGQTLKYAKGCPVASRPECGIGGCPLWFNNLSESDIDELANYNPVLTYGQSKPAPPEAFVPGYVEWDKKVLGFKAWLKETVLESPNEHFRVRPVQIYYYLEDESMAVVEPHVENSGLFQGQLVGRQRIAKNDVGDHWIWKDLNVGMNVTIFGRVYHIYDCDIWTREWLESQGIDVRPAEECMDDPYMVDRLNRLPVPTSTPSDYDKLRQFLEMDKKVLRFYCVWDDRDQMFGQLRKVILQYYLSDDTMDVKEVRETNDGYDPFPFLITRHRIPKDRYNLDPLFNLGAMEITDEEVKEYFTPKDFGIGKTLLVYNRRLLMYDCDNYTKAFYWKNFGVFDFTPVDITVKKPPPRTKEIPPYNLHGSLDDSMQNLRKVIPVPPRKDYCKMLDNEGLVLRYEALLDSNKPVDKCRKFIISYFLSDDTTSVYEVPIRNSGFTGGRFLDRTRVAKPDSPLDEPKFYGPQDYAIGATVDLFRHRFKIMDADPFVLKYLEDHCHQIPEHTMASLRENVTHCRVEERSLPVKECPVNLCRTGRIGELEDIVNEVKCQLKKMAITSSSKKYHIFLGFDVGRNGFITRENLQDVLVKHHLPCENDIVDSLARKIGQNPDHITLEELRKFFEE